MKSGATWLPLLALAACAVGDADADENGSGGNAGRAEPKRAMVEIAAPRLPTEAEVADALEADVQKSITNPPEGVIPEPDGLRTVVRKLRCTPLAAGGSRTACTFEETRSPIRFQDHEEAAEWVRETGTWVAARRSFAYTQETIGGFVFRGWKAQ